MKLLGSVAAGLFLLSSAGVQAASLDGVVVSITENSYFGNVDLSGPGCWGQTHEGPIGFGVELAAAPAADSCVGFFDVDIDPSTEQVTLTGRAIGELNLSRVVITGLAPYGVAGVTTLWNDLFDPTHFEGEWATAVPPPSISFDADSITITFSAAGLGDGRFTYGEDNEFTSVFQLSAVPEPQSWALMAFGLAAAGAAARRRSRA